MTRDDRHDTPSSRLCLSCGICCQGLFFFHHNDPATFGVDPASGATNQDLDRFPLTCLLFREGCLIHDHPGRPGCCRESRCQLLKRLERGEIDLEECIGVAERIRALFSSIRSRMPAVTTDLPLMDQIRELARQYGQTPVPAGDPTTALLLDIAALELLLRLHIQPIEGV